MNTIKITIEVNGKKISESTQEIEKEKYNEIVKICEGRKTSITSLLINDIDELTPEEAENIIGSWDM